MMRGFSDILLIIVGAILALFVLGVFATKQSFKASGTPISLNVLAQERKTLLPCGITVLDPKPNTQITLPLIVRGYVNGCGWSNAPIRLGYVKMLNDQGQIISAKYPLTRKDRNFNLPAYFEATIPSVIGNLQTPSATLFFTSNGGFNPKIFEVPVSF